MHASQSLRTNVCIIQLCLLPNKKDETGASAHMLRSSNSAISGNTETDGLYEYLPGTSVGYLSGTYLLAAHVTAAVVFT